MSGRQVLGVAVVFVTPEAAFAAPFARALGRTGRGGVFAAGDLDRPALAITPALAAGSARHQSLIRPDRFRPATEVRP